ncbi:CPBP family intramembrane glutamic endopeptidase [Petropleomorpha daqingensis]|uniref:Membrane protease YdiL (CAAX protease family) n=1 Tax=Petropleomorpha daqingensis TaxID=2026353 RepID=A0A853CD10_9ACTN|nr:CPBP family intramembrane glutamic endopeptidase [Petropleomorpha daqingensis]NYJ05654.1 membrane protease YdiL (CAAX protease family) [Petropleomorpha daqingensis]
MTTSVMPAPAPAQTRRSSPWTEIGVFLGVVVALSATTTTIALTQHADVRHVDSAPPGAQAALYGQALIPLLAAVVARLVTTGTLRRNGWGFRRTSWRSLGTAWAWSLGTTLAAGAIVWVTGAGGFRTAGLDVMVPLGLTVLALPYVLLAIGEDVGWRGLLVTRLAEVAGPRTVVLTSGLVWSAFHWPLILLLGGTPTGVATWWALLWFTVGTTAYGAVLASMQLRWGLWPGVLAHAVGNAVMYHVLEPLTADTGRTNWFATETGLVYGAVMLVSATVFLRFFPLARGAKGGTVAG